MRTLLPFNMRPERGDPIRPDKDKSLEVQLVFALILGVSAFFAFCVCASPPADSPRFCLPFSTQHLFRYTSRRISTSLCSPCALHGIGMFMGGRLFEPTLTSSTVASPAMASSIRRPETPP